MTAAEPQLFPTETRPVGLPECQHEGCEKPRRRAQAAKYCEDHATSINYRQPKAGKADVTCQVCGAEYATPRSRVGRHHADPLSILTCPHCRNWYGGFINVARRYKTPPRAVLEWIADPACAVCQTELHLGKRRHGRSGHIDHDHGCCPSSPTCGRCTRGLVCDSCNMLIGAIEKARTLAPMAEWLDFIDGQGRLL